MKIPGLKSAGQFTRWIRGRLFGGALILGYHRVGDIRDDHYGVCVSPEHFAEHLGIISRQMHPLSLPDLVRHLDQNSLPPRSVAVTFDDGYADNYYKVKPLLEKHQIPATVFISTAFLGGEFWWDELERTILSPPSIPQTLQVRIRGEVFEWRSKNLGNMSDNQDDESSRRELVDLLYRMLLPLEIEERENVLCQIETWSDALSKDLPEHRALTSDELLKLCDGGLIDIGSHTETHPMLSQIPVVKQRSEITASKEYLEALVSKPIYGFSYPNGIWTAELQSMVQEAGYLFACSSQRDLVWGSHQRYALPRFWPPDWDGDRLARDLNLWLGS